MAPPPKLYAKLPGRGLRKTPFAVSATRCRLWLAADHLLAVDSTVSTEEYRRFYFRDIEAFVLRRTAKRMVWNIVFVVLAMLTAGPLFVAWQSQGEGGFFIAAAVVGALWLAFLLANSVRGATCETHVRTAVQLEHLPSLGRLPVARRVLARLRPAIETAQGGVTPEALAEAPWIAPELAPGAAPDSAPTLPDKGIAHLLLALALIADCALGVMIYLTSSNALSTVNMVVTFLGFVVCIFALIRQRDRVLPSSLRIFAKSALWFYIAGFMVGMVFTSIFVFRHPGTPIVTGQEIAGEPGFPISALVLSVVAGVLGVIGVAQWIAWAGRRTAQSAP